MCLAPKLTFSTTPGLLCLHRYRASQHRHHLETGSRATSWPLRDLAFRSFRLTRCPGDSGALKVEKHVETVQGKGWCALFMARDERTARCREERTHCRGSGNSHYLCAWVRGPRRLASHSVQQGPGDDGAQVLGEQWSGTLLLSGHVDSDLSWTKHGTWRQKTLVWLSSMPRPGKCWTSLCLSLLFCQSTSIMVLWRGLIEMWKCLAELLAGARVLCSPLPISLGVAWKFAQGTWEKLQSFPQFSLYSHAVLVYGKGARLEWGLGVTLVGQHFSKCGPQTNSICIPYSPVENAGSQAPSLAESGTLGWDTPFYVFTRSLGDLRTATSEPQRADSWGVPRDGGVFACTGRLWGMSAVADPMCSSGRWGRVTMKRWLSGGHCAEGIPAAYSLTESNFGKIKKC